MNLLPSKLKLAKLVLGIDNPKIINQVLKVLKSGQADFWLTLTPGEKEEIRSGLEQLASGRRTSLKDFLRKVS